MFLRIELRDPALVRAAANVLRSGACSARDTVGEVPPCCRRCPAHVPAHVSPHRGECDGEGIAVHSVGHSAAATAMRRSDRSTRLTCSGSHRVWPVWWITGCMDWVCTRARCAFVRRCRPSHRRKLLPAACTAAEQDASMACVASLADSDASETQRAGADQGTIGVGVDVDIGETQLVLPRKSVPELEDE